MIGLDELRDEARRWLRHDAVLPSPPSDLDGRFASLRGWQRQLFEAGWMGLSWSLDAGGRGLSPAHQLVFAEELVRAKAPQPIGLIGLDVIGPSIDRYGSDWQRKRLLPRLLSGEDIWCQGFSEPEAGSDLASLRTSARVEDGAFVVNGQKVWTSWASRAEWCALLVRTRPLETRHRGLSYLLVKMSTPGITVRPIVQMTGEDEFCEVFFDEVRVPSKNLVGNQDEGWRIALDTLSTERGSYALRRRIELELALEDAVAALEESSSPWTVDGDQESRVAGFVGRAYVASRVLAARTEGTIDRMIRNTGPHPDDSVDKLILNAAEQRAYACIADILGPFRMVMDADALGVPAGRWAREHLYSRASSIYGGTSQIQSNIVAERLLGLPRA